MTKFRERSGEFWDSLTFSLLESAHPRMLYLRLTSYQAMALKLHCGHIIQCTKHYSEIVNETTVTSHIKLRSDIVHFSVYTTHWHHIEPHSMYSLTISLKLHCGELQWYHTLHTALKQNHQNRRTWSTPTYTALNVQHNCSALWEDSLQFNKKQWKIFFELFAVQYLLFFSIYSSIFAVKDLL